MRFPIGAMSVGDILDRGLKLLFARLGTFYVIGLIVGAPLLVFQLFAPQLGLTPQGMMVGGSPQGAILGVVLPLILGLILRQIGAAANLHVIAEEFVDRRVGVGSAFRFAFQRFGGLLWVSILAGLIVFVGTIFCIIPGIIFAIWYIFAGPVVVVENRHGMRALDRSKELTKGFRFRILGLLLLLYLIGFAMAFAVGFLGVFFPSYEMVNTNEGMRFVLNYGNYVISLFVNFLLSTAVEAFTSVCLVLFYFDLRIRKEGFDLELLARQQAPEALEPT